MPRASFFGDGLIFAMGCTVSSECVGAVNICAAVGWCYPPVLTTFCTLFWWVELIPVVNMLTSHVSCGIAGLVGGGAFSPCCVFVKTIKFVFFVLSAFCLTDSLASRFPCTRGVEPGAAIASPKRDDTAVSIA